MYQRSRVNLKVEQFYLQTHVNITRQWKSTLTQLTCVTNREEVQYCNSTGGTIMEPWLPQQISKSKMSAFEWK